MHSTTRQVLFGEYRFDIWVDVYEPSEDSFLFAENLDVDRGTLVLDVGTGCGILGILATEKAEEVVAVDINPHAVRCAKENARLNRVKHRMFFLQGNLFEPLETAKFDLIMFNAPYLPTEYREGDSWLERAWSGGPTGRHIIDRFITESPDHLGKHGRILLLQSTLCGLDETLNSFVEQGCQAKVVASKDLALFESIVLIEAKP